MKNIQRLVLVAFAISLLASGIFIAQKRGQVMKASVVEISAIERNNTLNFQAVEVLEVLTDGPPEMRYMRQHGVLNNLPDDKSVAFMDQKELEYVLFSFLNNINYLCRRLLRMGKMEDGGWFLCDDYEFRPMAPCIVYSFGINNDYSYDDDVARLYQCNVYSFDPSMNASTHDRSSLVHFYNVGLRGNDTDSLPADTAQLARQKKWDMRSFSQIKQMLGHQKKIIDVVKMDVEFSEWNILPDMIRTGQLNQVRQLQIEFHLKNFQDNLGVLRGLEDLGFQRIHTHKNPWCKYKSVVAGEQSTCTEISFVNSKFVRSRPV